MNRAQRIVAILGLISLTHTALVPPVHQPVDPSAEPACRYAAFVEGGVPFTRTHATPDADLAAMLGELVLIGALTGAVVLALGWRKNDGQHG